MHPEGRRTELKAFLRAMRARRAPEQVGLPPLERRRRTPGLRIEETASVAGVSLTWYSALEAGRNIRVSTSLLGRVADVLGLNADEREHLFALVAPRRAATQPACEDPTHQAIVDGFTTGPAFVSDRFWTVQAYNACADIVYDLSAASEKNLLVRMLLEPDLRALHEDWERMAQQMVAILHLNFGQTPDEPEAVALVARLNASSAEFTGWWNGFGLRRFRPTPAILHHPTLGRLAFTFTSFIASATMDSDEQAVIVLQPAADDETHARIRTILRAEAARAQG